ncbi:hypothetical protein PFISCL1PPCAC_7695, partial [Pristionchus fissidentatus]
MLHFLLIPQFFLSPMVTTFQQVEEMDTVDDIEKILALVPSYNRHAYPNQDRDESTEVFIQMYIEGMSSFRAQTMDFQLDIYFQEKWEDRRLIHNNTKRILVKDPKLFSLIWHPDLYFANARTAEFHHVTRPNFLVWIYPNGTVWYDCRVSLTALCMQDLARYPMDTQKCDLRILSYAYDNDQVIIKWNSDKPIEKNPDIRMPDMRLRSIKQGLRNDTYATGVWSCALAEFVVDREITHHIIQSYVPTALIVIISWFSFWLDVEAVPGRVSLSITTLLTLATQSSAARMALPQASYVKAIDVWMGACMAFVFSAMIEFTVVNYCTRRKPRKQKDKRTGLAEQVQSLVKNYREEKAVPLLNEESSPEMSNGMRTKFRCLSAQGNCYEVSLCTSSAAEQALIEKKQLREMNQSQPMFLSNRLMPLPSFKRKNIEEKIHRVERNRKYAQSIDRRSRFYFPLVFVVFNAVYWWYYAYYAPLCDPNN